MNTLERPGVFLDKEILVQSFAWLLVEFNSLSSNRALEYIRKYNLTLIP